MKKLFIHIGTHKTGTTSIQNVLRNNKQKLEKYKLVYLSFPRGILPDAAQFMRLESLNPQVISIFGDYLNSVIRKKEDLRYLISWEGFSGNPATGYANAGLIAKHIMESTSGIDVRLIVYLRRQDELIESLYGQRIKEGDSLTFQTYLNSIPESGFDWHQFLKNYSALSKNVTVRLYDRKMLTQKDSLLVDFFSIFGIDYQLLDQRTQTMSNKGYSKKALEITRLCNPYLNNDEKQWLRQTLQKISSKEIFEKYSYWTKDERFQFLDRYSISNANVALKYFRDKSGFLFSEPEKNNDDSLRFITLEELIPLIIKLVVFQKESSIVLKLENKLKKILRGFPLIRSKIYSLYK